MVRRIVRWGAWILGIAGAVLAVYVGVPTLDAALHSGRVARNVTLDGVHLGSLDGPSLDRHLAGFADNAAARTITLDGGDRRIEATLVDVGIAVDVAALRTDAMRAGRRGSVVERLRSWWSSFGTPRDVGFSFTADPVVAEAYLARLPDILAYPPVEPSYTGAGGELVVTPGIDGLALDPRSAATATAAVVGNGYPPAVVMVAWEPIPPHIDEASVAASLAAAEDLAMDLVVGVNGHRGTIGRSTVIRWIESELTEDGLVPRFDYPRAEAAVERLLAGFVDPGTPPVFTVVDGQVQAELGDEPMRCCAPGFGPSLEASARMGNGTILMLPPTPVYADAGLAAVEALGVEELVADFTTNHRCCQARVDNIHRIADMVRGHVIEPGGRFSINEFIGERTRDKGFVAAGVIESGHFTDDVGGGISQFATTMFNAAFLAGLEFETYQSHTIYISRYPYGREATLSFPEPDLVVVNPTPFAILIWTEYTDTSITVELYSTPYYVVEQTGQTTFRWGSACRRVNTYRSRTAPDGEVIEDFVFATYRPGEGFDCNGRPTPKPTT